MAEVEKFPRWQLDAAITAMQQLAALELEAIEYRGRFTPEHRRDFVTRYRRAKAEFDRAVAGNGGVA
jgi:hypothetical protein